MIKINKMQLLRFTLAGSSGGLAARGQRTLRAKIDFKEVVKFRR
jgi:hypothetical protein